MIVNVLFDCSPSEKPVLIKNKIRLNDLVHLILKNSKHFYKKDGKIFIGYTIKTIKQDLNNLNVYFNTCHKYINIMMLKYELQKINNLVNFSFFSIITKKQVYKN